MRSLVIVALLTSAAHAAPSKAQLAAALAKGDVETLRAATQFPLQVTSVWFDGASCLKFVGEHQVSERELAELVRCVADLQPRVDGELVVYGVGTPLWFELDASGRLSGVFSIYNTSHVDQRDAVPIDGKVFAVRLGKLVDELKPPAKDRARIDASRTLRARASVRLCVGKTGVVESVLVEDISPDLPAYGEHIEKVARAWTLKPFEQRGAPVRACSRLLVGYPDDRISRAELASAAKPPAPTPGPANVNADALETLRIAGNPSIVPDVPTKKQIAASGRSKIVGTWKVCVSVVGVVTSARVLKSSGFTAYDKTIEAAIASWAYKPFEVDGKALPVCTVQTIIYTP